MEDTIFRDVFFTWYQNNLQLKEHTLIDSQPKFDITMSLYIASKKEVMSTSEDWVEDIADAIIGWRPHTAYVRLAYHKYLIRSFFVWFKIKQYS
jgi:hypothetical protein